MHIRDLQLKAKNKNSLMRVGIVTTKELCAMSEKRILSIRNIGKKGLDDIISALNKAGLKIEGYYPPTRCTCCGQLLKNAK